MIGNLVVVKTEHWDCVGIIVEEDDRSVLMDIIYTAKVPDKLNISGCLIRFSKKDVRRLPLKVVKVDDR
ncbi:hypothetical protein [Peptacetobacter sp.]|uniref:hypothetical protein n=1 Tax=Peptacetobacter sp. TaxID=2991975 RepID=UPI003AB7B10D